MNENDMHYMGSGGGMNGNPHDRPLHPPGMQMMPPTFMPPNMPNPDPSMNSMQQIDTKSRTVFVGNIPYDAEDSQLKSILKLVGPFKTFRLKHDKETE